MSVATPDLFTLPPAPVAAPSPRHAMAGTGITLRFSQREDVDGLFHAIEGGAKKPCCIGATGYGKGSLIAETAGRMLRDGDGEVLVLVDRSHLVGQLADEIERHLGTSVGRVADGMATDMHRPIVVSTVQAMYTPDRSGRPLYTYSQFKRVTNVIGDEAHKFFAPVFKSVFHHFIDEYDAQCALFTATPVAANGAAWKSFIDWTAAAEGPCMRTTDWCIRNGYLVRPIQAFVRVDLNLSNIYEKLQFHRDSDESDNEDNGDELSTALVDLLKDQQEQAAARFAAGVARLLGNRRSIIFSPARVKAAKLIASWLSAGTMTCEPVWGARVDKAQTLRRHAAGEFQALSNVNLLCEGYNDPEVSAVFICRLLKQWRLVAQMIGRGLRPHPSVVHELNRLDGPEHAEARRRVIEISVKPDCIIADLVGLDGKVLQASAIDVLYSEISADTRQMMGEIILKRQSDARPNDPEVPAPSKELAEEARSELLNKQHEELAELARKRGMAGGIDADVEVSFDGGGPVAPAMPTPIQTASLGERARFVAIATKYDVGRAVDIAEKTPRNQLRGMTASMEKSLAKENKRPDWSRARQAYPEWSNQRRPS